MDSQENKWFTCYNARIKKYDTDGMLDLSLDRIDFLIKQICWWNRHAADTNDGYDIRTNQNNYIAPQTMVNMLMPFLNTNDLILDLGCGTGRIGEILPVDVTIDGIDFSKEMLNRAKQKGYRNMICAGLEQENFREIIPDTLYRVLIGVGVYGDYVDADWIINACDILDQKGIIAVAGAASRLNGKLTSLLKHKGFNIEAEVKQFAHIDENGNPLDYMYVIGRR